MYNGFNICQTFIFVCSVCAEPLSTYPTAKQLGELKFNHWFKTGLNLGLDKDELQSLKNSPQPSAATLLAAKVKNINLNWKHIVEGLLLAGENEVAESLCSRRGLSGYLIITKLQYHYIISG